MQISISNVIGRAANLITYAARLIKEFKARVATYPGSVFEAQACLTNTLNTISRIDLLNDASLIITPTAYNETKLYSVVPNTTLGDMDVVRATTATRVNELGLIEIVPRNLLTYSGDFSDASWVKAGGATITLSTIEPPFPNVKTYNLTNIGDSLKYISKDTGTIINASYSFYLKAIDASDIGKTFGFKISNSSPYLSLELTDEWQRIDVFSSPLTGNYFRLLSLGSEATTKVCIAAAQLEQGSLTEYFPTTTRLNIPRIDYTNGTCPSILVEPQRTNLLTYSEQFDNASWNKLACSVTLNSIISPNNTLTADSLIESNTNSRHMLFRSFVSVIGQSYTLSLFCKKNTRRYVNLNLKNSTGASPRFSAIFDLETGLNLSTSSFGSPTGTSFSIIDFNNGWYKVSITMNSTSVSTNYEISTSNSPTPILSEGSPSYLGDGTSGIYLWGAQLEAGSYATSYIPTVASTVTRNADVISKTGISSLIGQTEGTVFLEINLPNPKSTGGRTLLQIGSSSNRIYFAKDSNTENIFQLATQSSSGYNFINTSNQTGAVSKMAIAYKNGDNAFYLNGSLISVKSDKTNPTSLSQLIIGEEIYGNTDTKVNSVQLYKTRLSNSELAQLTTL